MRGCFQNAKVKFILRVCEISLPSRDFACGEQTLPSLSILRIPPQDCVPTHLFQQRCSKDGTPGASRFLTTLCNSSLNVAETHLRYCTGDWPVAWRNNRNISCSSALWKSDDSDSVLVHKITAGKANIKRMTASESSYLSFSRQRNNSFGITNTNAPNDLFQGLKN